MAFYTIGHPNYKKYLERGRNKPVDEILWILLLASRSMLP